jgi:hypothetical protein
MKLGNYSISKSSFLKFEQCAKAFFFYKKHPYLRDKLSVDKLLTFKRGHDIGFFAQQLFPGGIDVSKETGSASEAAELTSQLISEKRETIYEATFIFNEVLIMVDILHLQNNKYTAYEVKSSLKVSGVYVRDGCLQYYVLKNSLPNFDDIFLVTINGDYVFDGVIDPRKFFKKRSLKSDAEKNLLYFEEKIREASFVLERNIIPNITVGKHCFSPYQCDFFETCWKGLRDNDKSIFNMPLFGRDKLIEWYEQGLTTYNLIPDQQIESGKLLQIKKSFEDEAPIINNEQIHHMLAKVNEPVAAMDMEIWSASVPKLLGTRPFQQIPFLVCISDGSKQKHFITRHHSDERRNFAESLIELTLEYNTLLVYDRTMEELCINSLIDCFPDLSPRLTEVKSKLIDLFELVKNLYYFDPLWKNNFSLKAISGTLPGTTSYSDIHSGLEAMNIYEYFRIEDNQIIAQEAEIRLVKYCMTDALTTLEFWQFLKGI